jgi:predicted kinase
MLIAMAGLPGTGKSTLAHHLADACASIVLDKDSIRAALFPIDQVEYSTRQDDFCFKLPPI